MGSFSFYFKSWKRELLVLVTPRIIEDTGNNLKNYDFKLNNKESIELLNSIGD